jgi:flagellar biosynthesis protein FlhB
MSPVKQQRLSRIRNRTLARSFYQQLRTEGVDPEQIIEITGDLLNLVTEELRTPDGVAAK